MAEKIVRVCDVYGTSRTKRYTILVVETETAPLLVDKTMREMREGCGIRIDKTVDLSKRAYDRLAHFIGRGMRPPTAKSEGICADTGTDKGT